MLILLVKYKVLIGIIFENCGSLVQHKEIGSSSHCSLTILRYPIMKQKNVICHFIFLSPDNKKEGGRIFNSFNVLIPNDSPIQELIPQ